MNAPSAADPRLSPNTLAPGAVLVDAEHGPTGLTLKRLIGTGGMATVFLAEYDGTPCPALSPNTPRAVAIKLMQLKTMRMLQNNGFDPRTLVKKEVKALSRMMEAVPPPENVVSFYGAGNVTTDKNGSEHALPWLALEFVDGGSAGSTLLERLNGATQGFDPVRVLQITEQLLAGTRALHAHRVIHRDIKPENVFVAGPTDDETIKLGDCGIARVEGATIPTIPAMSAHYSAPEQYLSSLQPAESNPLIGPWTDVHALSALIWFLIAGEDWRTSSTDTGWREGKRRPVESGEKVHWGFRQQRELMARIDEVLRVGTAHGLAPAVWESRAAQGYKPLAPALGFGSSLWSEPRRYESVDALAEQLTPLLRQLADTWRERAAISNHPAVEVRPTLLLPTTIEQHGLSHTSAQVRGLSRIMALEGAAQIEPGNAAFQPDGRLLARFGARVAFYDDDRALLVAIPDLLSGRVRDSRWVARLPGGGFALASPGAITLIQNGAVRELELPRRETGASIGPIQAVLGDASAFGIVTAEADYRGGPELWLWTQSGWRDPVVVPMAGDARFVTTTPFGYLFVGSHPCGKGRAALLGFDRQAVSFVPWLTDAPPLTVGVGGTERVSWVAGGGRVLRIERAGCEVESSGISGEAVAMGLDPIGSPWLVSEDTVLRRHMGTSKPTWLIYLTRKPEEPRYVAIGFTPRGAHILDQAGAKRRICPPDTKDWKALSA